MQSRVYVAGPVESSPNPKMNEPLFDFAARRLRAQGCFVLNPAELGRELIGSVEKLQAMSLEDRKAVRRGLLAKELTWIVTQADMVFMLPDWEISPGAKAEHATALALGIEVQYAPDNFMEEFKKECNVIDS